MRVIMPIFQFHYEGNEFRLSDNYSLEHFDPKRDIPQNVGNGLSVIDRSYISQESWALVAINPNKYFKPELNLLLITFRIYAKSNAFIKWRFCEVAPQYSTSLNDRFRNLTMVPEANITEETLNKVKNGFKKIIEMYSISDRTKNALYFIWRGFCVEKHIDAYILFVCAIEALFSNETAEDITKTVINRTKRFMLGVKGFGGDQIKSIYKIRSDMVHGRIPYTAAEDITRRKENLSRLAKLEGLVLACMERILEKKIYLKYKTVEEKENFLNSL